MRKLKWYEVSGLRGWLLFTSIYEPITSLRGVAASRGSTRIILVPQYPTLINFLGFYMVFFSSNVKV